MAENTTSEAVPLSRALSQWLLAEAVVPANTIVAASANLSPADNHNNSGHRRLPLSLTAEGVTILMQGGSLLRSLLQQLRAHRVSVTSLSSSATTAAMKTLEDRRLGIRPLFANTASARVDNWTLIAELLREHYNVPLRDDDVDLWLCGDTAGVIALCDQMRQAFVSSTTMGQSAAAGGGPRSTTTTMMPVSPREAMNQTPGEPIPRDRGRPAAHNGVSTQPREQQPPLMASAAREPWKSLRGPPVVHRPGPTEGGLPPLRQGHYVPRRDHQDGSHRMPPPSQRPAPTAYVTDGGRLISGGYDLLGRGGGGGVESSLSLTAASSHTSEVLQLAQLLLQQQQFHASLVSQQQLALQQHREWVAFGQQQQLQQQHALAMVSAQGSRGDDNVQPPWTNPRQWASVPVAPLPVREFGTTPKQLRDAASSSAGSTTSALLVRESVSPHWSTPSNIIRTPESTTTKNEDGEHRKEQQGGTGALPAASRRSSTKQQQQPPPARSRFTDSDEEEEEEKHFQRGVPPKLPTTGSPSPHHHHMHPTAAVMEGAASPGRPTLASVMSWSQAMDVIKLVLLTQWRIAILLPRQSFIKWVRWSIASFGRRAKSQTTSLLSPDRKGARWRSLNSGEPTPQSQDTVAQRQSSSSAPLPLRGAGADVPKDTATDHYDREFLATLQLPAVQEARHHRRMNPATEEVLNEMVREKRRLERVCERAAIWLLHVEGIAAARKCLRLWHCWMLIARDLRPIWPPPEAVVTPRGDRRNGNTYATAAASSSSSPTSSPPRALTQCPFCAVALDVSVEAGWCPSCGEYLRDVRLFSATALVDCATGESGIDQSGGRRAPHRNGDGVKPPPPPAEGTVAAHASGEEEGGDAAAATAPLVNGRHHATDDGGDVTVVAGRPHDGTHEERVASLRDEKWRLTLKYDALDFHRRFPLRWPAVHAMIAMVHRFLRGKRSYWIAHVKFASDHFRRAATPAMKVSSVVRVLVWYLKLRERLRLNQHRRLGQRQEEGEAAATRRRQSLSIVARDDAAVADKNDISSSATTMFVPAVTTAMLPPPFLSLSEKWLNGGRDPTTMRGDAVVGAAAKETTRPTGDMVLFPNVKHRSEETNAAKRGAPTCCVRCRVLWDDFVQRERLDHTWRRVRRFQRALGGDVAVGEGTHAATAAQQLLVPCVMDTAAQLHSRAVACRWRSRFALRVACLVFVAIAKLTAVPWPVKWKLARRDRPATSERSDQERKERPPPVPW